MYFDLGYTDAGWGWLKPIGGDDDVKVMLSRLGFILKACKVPDGRIFVQSTKEKTTTWIDDVLNQKRVHSMQVYDHKLRASVFTTERQILQLRAGPRSLGGRVFWDVRSMKPFLKFDYGDHVFHQRFVITNFKSVKVKCTEHFEAGGGLESASHFLYSDKPINFQEAVSCAILQSYCICSIHAHHAIVLLRS